MTLVLETGAGLRASNSYATVAFATTYLTDRGRAAENGWDTAAVADQEAALIAATAYIDTRWGPRFKGLRLTAYGGLNAQAIVMFDGALDPVDGDTITIGQQVYLYVNSLSVLGNNEILALASPQESAICLIAAVNGGDGRGTQYSQALQPNEEVTAALLEGTDDEVLLTAKGQGAAGNNVTLDETSSGIEIISQFVNGLDAAVQALEFPRQSLYDTNGVTVLNIPVPLQQATAEYAVRAHAAALYQDPVVDETGKAVTESFEKVGPIETRTKFEEGGATSNLIKPYPAADKLLQEYVFPAGRVFRG